MSRTLLDDSMHEIGTCLALLLCQAGWQWPVISCRQLSVYADYITLQCTSKHLSAAACDKLSGHSSQRHGQVQHLAAPAHQPATTHAPHATARPSRTSNAAALHKA
jgi:hypothetical protein